jgi:hypothetical protein
MSESKSKTTKTTTAPVKPAAPTKAAPPAAAKPAEPTPAPQEKVAAPASPAPSAKVPAKAETKPKTETIVLSTKEEPAKKPAANSRKPAASPATPSNLPDQSVIDKMVHEAAYYLAEKRNFAPGFEEEDWLRAKEQIMTQLLAAKKPTKPKG